MEFQSHSDWRKKQNRHNIRLIVLRWPWSIVSARAIDCVIFYDSKILKINLKKAATHILPLYLRTNIFGAHLIGSIHFLDHKMRTHNQPTSDVRSLCDERIWNNSTVDDRAYLTLTKQHL